MIKKNKWQLILSSIIILLPVVIGLFMWNDLPEQIAAHWNVKGEPDRWNTRTISIFGIPVFLFVLHWICLFFTAHDPKNKDQNGKVFSIIIWILPMMSLIICGVSYASAFGNNVRIEMIVRIFLSLVFIALGNYMPKCRQNYTIGIKVVWALRNEENWNQTHRFAGRLWFFGGFVLLATIFLPLERYMYGFLAFVFFMAFAPMIYSYMYYRKQLKAGTAAKDDIKLRPFEKRAAQISVLLMILILSFAAAVFCTGKFKVMFSDTSFTIKATYWENATVNYADIDSIEYKEEAVSGVRTFGYGSPFLIMGECENEQFGKYTKYAYASCDASIVLTIDGKILVINGKDTGQTKQMYEQLMSRIQSGQK